jgi:hypothetical protein
MNEEDIIFPTQVYTGTIPLALVLEKEEEKTDENKSTKSDQDTSDKQM